MKKWPEFNEHGDLPVGIHQATLTEVIEHFGGGSLQRRQVAERLIHIYNLAHSTGHIARFIVYGSFVTAKPSPNDVDVFILMDDSFRPAKVKGEVAIIFDHMATHKYQGASVFWTTRTGAIGGEQSVLEDWQYKRDKTKRGIVEVISRD
ncbi:MAG TPA: hypothetical protein VGN95_05105 [Pyrinomonadaceae bacterium]|jgi:hypothetical protein|nr:hypothetical protein [Pyrinomonadaceae bacterium]